MKTPEPNQAYIDELIRSIQADEELEYQKLVKLLFAIIDHFFAQLEARRQLIVITPSSSWIC
jgi:5-carboxymethyl-2-hydroxymuconate isomerase